MGVFYPVLAELMFVGRYRVDEDPRCAGKATRSIYQRAERGFLADRHVAGGNIFTTASMMHPLCDSYAKPIRLGALPSAARIIVPRDQVS